MILHKHSWVFPPRTDTGQCDQRIREAALTVVTLSISPVIPEVGVLFEVLSNTCCSHPGTLQNQQKNQISLKRKTKPGTLL